MHEDCICPPHPQHPHTPRIPPPGQCLRPPGGRSQFTFEKIQSVTLKKVSQSLHLRGVCRGSLGRKSLFSKAFQGRKASKFFGRLRRQVTLPFWQTPPAQIFLKSQSVSFKNVIWHVWREAPKEKTSTTLVRKTGILDLWEGGLGVGGVFGPDP